MSPEDYQKLLESRLMKAADEIALKLRLEIMKVTPVKTGALQSSISVQPVLVGDTIQIGAVSTLPYGIYQEHMTKKGEASGTAAAPVSANSKGNPAAVRPFVASTIWMFENEGIIKEAITRNLNG